MTTSTSITKITRQSASPIIRTPTIHKRLPENPTKHPKQDLNSVKFHVMWLTWRATSMVLSSWSWIKRSSHGSSSCTAIRDIQAEPNWQSSVASCSVLTIWSEPLATSGVQHAKKQRGLSSHAQVLSMKIVILGILCQWMPSHGPIAKEANFTFTIS